MSCIWEVNGLNLGPTNGSADIFVAVFLSPFSQVQYVRFPIRRRQIKKSVPTNKDFKRIGPPVWPRLLLPELPPLVLLQINI
jgi:hypothetical protein